MTNKDYFNKVESPDAQVDNQVDYYKSINWNNMSDIDKVTWDKLNSQFWLDTRVPVSNDRSDWAKLSEAEKDALNKALMGLTLLDTLQSEEGANVMKGDVRTQHELAVLNQILLMESIHSKSYSTIFTSLLSPKEINELFAWGNQNEQLQFKAKKINAVYQDGTALQKKIASVFLESFLFYSGFYAPLYFLGNNKMANVAEIIKLIIRDESVHGVYLGYKFQQGFKELSEDEQSELQEWMFELLYDLYENEMKYTELVYDQVGWSEDIKVYVRYNANKALVNLGFDPVFEDSDAEDVNPVVINGISTETTNHDFFSQVGSGYLMGESESMDEDDYDF